jgi:hypothetical protein
LHWNEKYQQTGIILPYITRKEKDFMKTIKKMLSFLLWINAIVGGTTINRTDLVRQKMDNDFYGTIFSELQRIN